MDTKIKTILLKNIFEKIAIECDRGCPDHMVTNGEYNEFAQRNFEINCKPEECDCFNLQRAYSQLIDRATLHDALVWVDHPIMGEVADYLTKNILKSEDEFGENILTEDILNVI